MPRVHMVKKARKAIPHAGVEVGDTYYYWEFRSGGRQVSKTYPKRQQLTQSSYLQQLYDIDDARSALCADDGLADAASDLAQQLRDLASECQDSLDNMPDSLQSSPTGELLQERIDQCEQAADSSSLSRIFSNSSRLM